MCMVSRWFPNGVSMKTHQTNLSAICVATVVFGVFGTGGANAGADSLKHEIAALLSSVSIRSDSYAVVVRDLDSGATVYAHNADRPLIPASNQKLFAMATAMDVLGADFSFRTVLGRHGRDLVIVGSGDPAIGDAKLCKQRGVTGTYLFESWAKQLLSAGVAAFGDLIVDESMFDDQRTHPTWESGDLQKWFAAPASALNLNDNCVEITVWPGASGGARPNWSVHPPSSLVKLVNRAVSARDGVPVIARPAETFRFILSGRCGRRSTLAAVAVPDPGLFFADSLRVVLLDAGVRSDGDIRRVRMRNADGEIPSELSVIAEHRTPLVDVLGRIGRNSQNLFADCLFKRVGFEHARRAGQPSPVGSWQTGSDAVRAFLGRAGIDDRGLKMVDASGLSRKNRATAGQFVDLLAYMHRHDDGNLFRDSLAVAGRDGSLRKRMHDLGENVRGKTGTMRRVSALSGYVFAPSGRSFAFSILFNNYRGSSRPYRRIQDDLCRLLASAESRVGR